MKRTIILIGVVIIAYTAAVFSIGRFYGTRRCFRMVESVLAGDEIEPVGADTGELEQ